MQLIKKTFSIFFGIAALAVGALANAPLALADEVLALSTSLTAPPESLSSARNVKLELIPDSELAKSDLWVRIRGGFAMRDGDAKLVAMHEKWYANRPEYVERMTDRARRYLYYITSEVERRGMPSEIALLPMIESAFNPGAYSNARASGIWQFIPSTGKKYGMEQNWWHDGRRDIISATNGALDYLQQLHDQFGDWDLALAAYNCGEGAVERAQKRNRKRGLPINYSSLKLPRETRHYVPKLLAIKNIVANPASFALVLQDIPNAPYFAAVKTARHIDVKLAAQLADITMEEFIALNPGNNRPVILQDNGEVVLLPLDKIETFRANLESYDKPLVSWQAYKPKKGERLDKLAPRFGLSVEKLKAVNGLDKNNISTGQTLLVPSRDDSADADSEFAVFNMHLAPNSDSGTRTIIHKLRRGQTLESIASRYHVSLASLESSNEHLDQIKPGHNIVVVQVFTRKHVRRRHLARSKRNSHKVAQHRAHKTPPKVAQRRTSKSPASS